MNPLSWFLVFLVVGLVLYLSLRWRCAGNLRKELMECTTHRQAGLISSWADEKGFLELASDAKNKEQELYTDFLQKRKEQFEIDLEEASESEEKLLRLFEAEKYCPHPDPFHDSYSHKRIREKLRPFTEKRINEAISTNDLLFLRGARYYLKQFFFNNGFDRIDETLEDVFFRKTKQLACKEALASESVHDTCFQFSTSDKVINALIVMKREAIALKSQRTSFDLGGLYQGVDAALIKAYEVCTV